MHLILTKFKKHSLIIAPVMLCMSFFFLLGHNAHAFEDDFEDKTLGNIDGQEPWLHDGGATNFHVSYSAAKDGAKGLELRTGGASSYTATTSENSFIDIECFDFYINGDLGVTDNLLIKPQTATSHLATIYIQETGTSSTYEINADGNIYNSGMLASTWYNLCIRLDLALGTYWVRIDDNTQSADYNLVYPGATLTHWDFIIGNLDVEIYLDNFGSVYELDPDLDVDIVEYPYDFTAEVIGAMGFTAQEVTHCIEPDVATTSCKVNIWYGDEYYGQRAILVPFDGNTLDTTDYEDIIMNLGKNGRLGLGKDYLEATNSDNNYKESPYYVITWQPGQATSTNQLHGLIRVVWYSIDEYYSMSDEEKETSKIIERVKNIFPFSFWFLIQSRITSAKDDITAENRFELGFDDFLGNTIYASSTEGASSTLFSYEFLEQDENIGTILDVVKNVIAVILWIITIVIILLIIFKTFTSND